MTTTTTALADLLAHLLADARNACRGLPRELRVDAWYRRWRPAVLSLFTGGSGGNGKFRQQDRDWWPLAEASGDGEGEG